jgi:MFS family permease
MSGRHRTIVAGLLLLGVLALVILVAFAGSACPAETEAQPCPDAGRNVVVAVVLAVGAVVLIVTPFAFMGEVLARRRIVYRGAWGRAARRGILAGLVVATLAGLRLAGVLSVPTGLFTLVLAAVIEWFFVRNDE